MQAKIRKSIERALTRVGSRGAKSLRLWFFAALAVFGFALPASAAAQPQESAALRNPLLYAIAWRQTAAEYRALYYQGFAIAQLRVQEALAARAAGTLADDRPLAVITDVDETVLLSGAYWGQLISEGGDFFDDASWDAWVPKNEFIASPGAQAFVAFCEANDVEVFYVTNRDQGEATFELALGNLDAAGLGFARAANLRVLRESSNKEAVQAAIRADYHVVASLGDNLNDFARRYYVADIEQRSALMHEDGDRFGKDYIVFPNPTDGHWIRAIFGESEPAPTEANRAVLRAAAIGQ